MFNFLPLLPYGIEAHQTHDPGRLTIHATHVKLIDGRYLTTRDIWKMVTTHVQGLNGTEQIRPKPLVPYLITSEGHRLRVQRMKGQLEVFHVNPGPGEVEIDFRHRGTYHVEREDRLDRSKSKSAAKYVKYHFVSNGCWELLPRP